MNDKPFMLNGRFIINPSTGLVNDTLQVKETRIEPRLMNLLVLLATNHGALVSRDLITREIWNDYGNADEGLTQAISYLRKVLADDKKALIETVPKKGYILHAQVSGVAAEKETGLTKRVRKPAFMWLAAIALLLIIAAWLILKPKQQVNGSDLKDPIQNALHDSDNKKHNPDVLQDSANNHPASGDQRK